MKQFNFSIIVQTRRAKLIESTRVKPHADST